MMFSTSGERSTTRLKLVLPADGSVCVIGTDRPRVRVVDIDVRQAEELARTEHAERHAELHVDAVGRLGSM